MDGNTAAAYASYAFTEVAAIFPITPSSQMAEIVDEWASQGKKNLFGQPVRVVEMQSEGGAAGACHGSLQAGALTTTYTASQGLLLMIPPMFRIAGEHLPGVFHIATRTVAENMWSIYGDHSDIMTTRSTGFAMLASASPQEAMDLGMAAHLAAIKARHPFLHFFDGFRTSHELQKIDVIDYEELRGLVDYGQIDAFRRNSLNPEHPFIRGTTASGDVFFQGREASNPYYEAIPDIVQQCMDQINAITGRNYRLYEYYGAPDAEECVIAMCSGTQALREAVDYLNERGRKVGMISVHLFRPFSAKHFLAALPATVRRVAVLDRTKESGSVGEPLFLDVTGVLANAGRPMDLLIGGRFGLSSKDTTSGQMIAVYDNLIAEHPKRDFTIGIIDDLSFKSLEYRETDTSASSVIACKIWGTGGDGTVGANKNSVKIIGELSEKYAQAYFAYDAKKSGGVTQSHLRFSDEPIYSTYLVQNADLVAVHNPAYIEKFDTISDLKQGGTYLLNCPWSPAELEDRLPADLKRGLAEKDALLYIIDASGEAMGLGLGSRTNTVLQAAFMKLTGIIPTEQALRFMKEEIEHTYRIKSGEKVVEQNCRAADRGIEALKRVPVPEHWKTLAKEEVSEQKETGFLGEIILPMNRMQGDRIPVSVFQKYATFDGSWPSGTSKYDKRGDSLFVPSWNPYACIQCNRCSLVCPHAAIRVFLTDEEEERKAPESFRTIPAKGEGMQGYGFRIQVSPQDCLSCSNCVNACPAKGKALTMASVETQKEQRENWKYASENISIKQTAVRKDTVKGLQFARHYYEFPPACAGCGETAYVRMVTQLYGDHMYIGNASGCTAVHGGCLPSTPYCKDDRGFGPPWEQSLFEDTAEFAFGFLQAHEAINEELIEAVRTLIRSGIAVTQAERYLASRQSAQESREAADALLKALELFVPEDEEAAEAREMLRRNREFLSKKSVWAFGGDGWAYDIGFGGLDHVLASGKDINMLVMDTEVYSNTGGQASKATGLGATAQFAAGGKTTVKKDLGRMLMTYGYIYVAQVSMGADPAQTLRAIREAEAYPGPAVVIAYAPCTAHGIEGGMENTQLEMKRAVDCGYWHLYRYNPLLAKEGKNPFILDSKEPKMSYLEFIRSERRYAAMEAKFPEKAKELFERAEKNAKEKYRIYKAMADAKEAER